MKTFRHSLCSITPQENKKTTIFGSIEKGFTLVELIMSIGILAILLTILTNAFGSILDVQLDSVATSVVDQDGRYMLAKLIHDTQNASAILQPAVGSSSAILQITMNSQNYTYSLNNGNFQITDNTGTENLNSTDTAVSGLTFQRIGIGNIYDTVRTSFVLTSRSVLRGVPETKTYQTTLGLQ